jgi:hypothetical protein
MSPLLTSTTYFLSVAIGGMLYSVFITLAIMASVINLRLKHRQNRPQGQHDTNVSQTRRRSSRSWHRGGCFGLRAVIRWLGFLKLSFSGAMTTALIVVITIVRATVVYYQFVIHSTYDSWSNPSACSIEQISCIEDL